MVALCEQEEVEVGERALEGVRVVVGALLTAVVDGSQLVKERGPRLAEGVLEEVRRVLLLHRILPLAVPGIDHVQLPGAGLVGPDYQTASALGLDLVRA